MAETDLSPDDSAQEKLLVQVAAQLAQGQDAGKVQGTLVARGLDADAAQKFIDVAYSSNLVETLRKERIENARATARRAFRNAGIAIALVVGPILLLEWAPRVEDNTGVLVFLFLLVISSGVAAVNILVSHRADLFVFFEQSSMRMPVAIVLAAGGFGLLVLAVWLSLEAGSYRGARNPYVALGMVFVGGGMCLRGAYRLLRRK